MNDIQNKTQKKLEEIRKTSESIYSEVSGFGASLAIATKTHFDAEVLSSAVFDENIVIAENRVQEAEAKKEVLDLFPNKKHFIGTLQKNKVRKVVKIFDCIETVDSFSLLERINRIAKEEEKMMQVFLHVNISNDEKKNGMSVADTQSCIEKFSQNEYQSEFSHVQVSGLFTILQNNLSADKQHFFYAQMKTLLCDLQTEFPTTLPEKVFHQLSLGMSSDYAIALQEGATIVRVGTKIFGKRD